MYVTLRLTATMYHRFHAMHDLRVDRVTYIAGDTWNVNPPALKRIERLYCRNERAAMRNRGESPDGYQLVGQLLRYSEMGGEYVRFVRLIMRENSLADFDRARLSGF